MPPSLRGPRPPHSRAGVRLLSRHRSGRTETGSGGSCSPVAAMSRSRRCSERDTEAEADLNLNMHLHLHLTSHERTDDDRKKMKNLLCSALIISTASVLQIAQMLAAVPLLCSGPRRNELRQIIFICLPVDRTGPDPWRVLHSRSKTEAKRQRRPKTSKEH